MTQRPTMRFDGMVSSPDRFFVSTGFSPADTTRTRMSRGLSVGYGTRISSSSSTPPVADASPMAFIMVPQLVLDAFSWVFGNFGCDAPSARNPRFFVFFGDEGLACGKVVASWLLHHAKWVAARHRRALVV
jgi:hypothetical protein